ncbi:MAG TPA: hypothetical protein VIN96_16045 [Magnetovibrio sp.]
MTDTQEDWEHVKLGRFRDADEQLVMRIMDKRFPQRLKSGKSSYTFKTRTASSPRVQERISRSNVLNWRYEHTQGREAAVTVKFCTKHKSQAISQLKYIARIRSQDTKAEREGITLFNEFGDAITPTAACSEMQTWELNDSGENLDAPQHPQPRRRQYIQTWHLILSIEDDLEEESELSRFQAAVDATIDEAFTANGHRALWCIHSGHTQHTHAHVIVRALSDLGGRIHSDIYGDYLHGLRVVFAKHLKRAGFDYDATRRVDRAKLRDHIMSGAVPLTNTRLYWRDAPVSEICARTIGAPMAEGVNQLQQARAGALRCFQDGKIEQCAKYLRLALSPPPNLLGLLKRKLVLKCAANKTKNVPDEYRDLLETFRPMYLDPYRALVSWHRLATSDFGQTNASSSKRSSARLANWVARHRPEWFGPVRAEAFETMTLDRLRKVLYHQKTLPPNRARGTTNSDDGIFECFWLRRVHKDRYRVVWELNRFAKRIETEVNNLRLSARIFDLVTQAQRIPITYQKPTRYDLSTHGMTPVKQTSRLTYPNETPLPTPKKDRAFPVKTRPIIRPKQNTRSGVER